MNARYSGVIPPIVTPMVARDQLDFAGLERLIEHVLAAGVQGIFVLGTTGEAPSLSYALRREVIAETIRIVASRVPVLVGITDTAFVESVRLAKHAANCGADALVLSTPYYFPAGQTELKYYVDELMMQLPLPVMLYNIPSLTKVSFEIDTLEYLCRHNQIVGLKDSSGDLEYFSRALELKKRRPDWSILIGPEALLAQSLVLGGDGGVAGGANLCPRWFVELFHAVRSGNTPWEELQNKIERLQAIYDIGKYTSRFIKGTKCGLSLMAICDDFMADPFHRFRPDDRARVAAILRELEVL
ncbi:MAG: dihydrodipicolinate synthase family protein [Pirellula sp.]|nr:dihydrodipicolinate synthase family protein [Pirellula sp.]